MNTGMVSSPSIPNPYRLGAQGIRYLLRQITHQREQVLLALPEGVSSPMLIVPESVTQASFELQSLLLPEPAVRALRAGDNVQLSGRLNGAVFRLSVELDAVHMQAQDGQLRCHIPDSGELHERRACPRFAPPSTGPRTVAVVHVPGEIMLCQLVNISREGIRLRLEVPHVDIGDEQVVFCEVRREHHLLQSKADVRWRKTPDGTHQEFGARFLARDPDFLHRLHPFVAELERYWARMRA